MFHHIKSEPSHLYYASPQPPLGTSMHNLHGFPYQYGFNTSPIFSPTYELPVELPSEGGSCLDDFIIMKKRYGLWKELSQAEILKDFIPSLQRKYPNALKKNQKINVVRPSKGKPRGSIPKIRRTPGKTSETPGKPESDGRKCRHKTHDGKPFLRSCNVPSDKHYATSEDDVEEELRGARVPPPEEYKTHFEGCNTSRYEPSPIGFD